MNVYKVAVCDDDDVFRESLCCLLCEILTEEGIKHEITDFSSALELKEVLDMQDNSFNMLILDVKMEKMNGMELANFLRSKGERVSIIFITAYDDYLLEGYNVQPVHFLLKPVEKGKLADALRLDLKLNYLSHTVTLQIGNRTVRLFLSDIRYIESFNHNVIIHYSGMERTYGISISELERRLPSVQFCRCHKSYLVNLEYVREIGRTELYLRGNEMLPVGRVYYKIFQGMFIRYLNQ